MAIQYTGRKFPFPALDGSDTPDVPRDVNALAVRADADFLSGTFGARPAASNDYVGRRYYATDTGDIWLDIGSGWVLEGSSSLAKTASPAFTGVPTVPTAAVDTNTTQIASTAFVVAQIADDVAALASPAPVNLASRSILDVGVTNQTRAGRQLLLADITTLLGLTAPAGLWGLGDLTDLSGNARAFTNKGALTFGKGVTGATPEALICTGSTAQALYIADAAWQQIRTGSFGAWCRTPRRGVLQDFFSKMQATNASRAYELGISAANLPYVTIWRDAAGTTSTLTGQTDVADNRFHHIFATYDGTRLCLYVDGVLDAAMEITGLINAGTGPLNVGGYGADAGTNSANPFFGVIDEALLTPDVLSEDQIRLLYAVKIAHGASFTPRAVRTNVIRRRRGPLVSGDFSVAPLHLYNFTAAALTDAGSLNNALTNNGTAVSIAGVDGASGGAFALNGSSQYFSVTDTGLPGTTTARTVGARFRSFATAQGTIFDYGTAAGNARFTAYLTAAGLIAAGDGSNLATSVQTFNDGQWHDLVVTYDHTATDTAKIKVYVDGRLVASSTSAITSTTLAGANALRFGATLAAANYFNGALDSLFVTNYTMAPDEVAKLYNAGSLPLGRSPLDPGECVEQVDATNVYFIGDRLEGQNQVDLTLAA